MARNTQLTDAAVSVQADAMAALLDGGFVDVMSGAQPASGDTPIDTQKVLVVMSFGKPAFRPASLGVIEANTIAPGIAIATGDPTWFRAYRADHKTSVFDGSAGKTNANMILPAKTIVEGVTVGCSSLTHTVVKSQAGI